MFNLWLQSAIQHCTLFSLHKTQAYATISDNVLLVPRLVTDKIKIQLIGFSFWATNKNANYSRSHSLVHARLLAEVPSKYKQPYIEYCKFHGSPAPQSPGPGFLVPGSIVFTYPLCMTSNLILYGFTQLVDYHQSTFQVVKSLMVVIATWH